VSPSAVQGLACDPVCTTHHIIGLALIQRTGCPTPVATAALRQILMSDIVMQTRGLRHWLEQHWPGAFPAKVEPLDFHATAQGLLLTALSLPAAH
jgi:hypothetical protein